MNSTDYVFILNNPQLINEKYTDELTSVIEAFPYFQSARALRLKGLYNQNSFRYNFALKVAAAYTTDRTVLFHLITSNTFHNTQNQPSFSDTEKEETKPTIENITVNLLEQSIQASIKEASMPTKTKKNVIIAVENLNLGKPIPFSKNEKHSFQEWLQLAQIKPILRNEKNNQSEEIDEKKKKKIELIDQFIENNPKIPPIKPGNNTAPVFDLNTLDNSYLMTETLAKVYLEQKKYQKAIQAYEILILKYPEKSSYFADCIADIKIIQNQ